MKNNSTLKYFHNTKIGAMRKTKDYLICSHGNKKEQCSICNKEDKLAAN